jgi:hypothetical protein
VLADCLSEAEELSVRFTAARVLQTALTPLIRTDRALNTAVAKACFGPLPGHRCVSTVIQRLSQRSRKCFPEVINSSSPVIAV